ADVPFKIKKGEEMEVAYSTPEGAATAVVFKTIADPFVGKLSYFKVLKGNLKADMKVKVSRTGEEEKLSKLSFIKAGKQEDADVITAGDIGCASKLGNVITGDTLSSGEVVSAVTVPFPNPTLSMAIYPKKKGEEEKIAAGLTRLAEEDPTVIYKIDHETKESVLSGLGEQHLDVIVSKLKSKFGVEVELKTPAVAYRETIRKSVKVQGRHKKQSGGHGQFGDVWIEFEPTDSDELVFEEKVFGGAVPKNFFPAVEKGLRECIAKGLIAGYPMVGIKAALHDGSYHPVDSSEMAFKTAASIAFKEGISNASPTILEPIGTLTAVVPDDNLGDVIGDINKRRGRVIGMNPLNGHKQEVMAEVPMAEMGDFSTAMRSITQGRATFTLEFARYEDAPAPIQQKIIQKANQE
ncbi:MAG: EF-Tu/IF-2/RF-3 family GTPase, partial [Acutalibacteraceae bacterium]|nr:EF-Tu/IF-2/RF-3 family GTPase [Acutalibacteraceae bacterium]